MDDLERKISIMDSPLPDPLPPLSPGTPTQDEDHTEKKNIQSLIMEAMLFLVGTCSIYKQTLDIIPSINLPKVFKITNPILALKIARIHIMIKYVISKMISKNVITLNPATLRLTELSLNELQFLQKIVDLKNLLNSHFDDEVTDLDELKALGHEWGQAPRKKEKLLNTSPKFLIDTMMELRLFLFTGPEREESVKIAAQKLKIDMPELTSILEGEGGICQPFIWLDINATVQSATELKDKMTQQQQEFNKEKESHKNEVKKLLEKIEHLETPIKEVTGHIRAIVYESAQAQKDFITTEIGRCVNEAIKMERSRSRSRESHKKRESQHRSRSRERKRPSDLRKN